MNISTLETESFSGWATTFRFRSVMFAESPRRVTSPRGPNNERLNEGINERTNEGKAEQTKRAGERLNVSTFEFHRVALSAFTVGRVYMKAGRIAEP